MFRNALNRWGKASIFASRQSLRSSWSALALAFFFPFLLRLLPQLLAGPSVPIGYDTVAGYAPFASFVQKNGIGNELFLLLRQHLAPILWVLLGLLATIGIPPFTLVQILPPFLYGGLGVALWRFARQALGCSSGAALGGVLLTLGYFLPLRYGWDNLKDVAGVALLLLALAEVPRFGTIRGRLLFAFLSIASVLTEEIEAVLLGGIAAVLFLQGLRNRRISSMWLLTGLGCMVIVLFYVGLLGPIGPGPFPPYGLPQALPQNPSPLLSIVPYSSWWDKAAAAGLMIAVGVAPLAYPAWGGRLRSGVADAWLFAATIGTFGIFFIPEGTFPAWPTWLVLLSFPLGLRASHGLAHMNRRRATAVIIALAILAGGFIILPSDYALPYFASPETRWYVPSSMVQTTIPLDRVVEVKAAVAWLNTHATEKDWIVVSDVFSGFVAVLGDATRLYPYRRVEWVDWSLFLGSNNLYSIYWSDRNVTWFAGGSPPKAFREVFAEGGVAVLAARACQLVPLGSRNE